MGSGKAPILFAPIAMMRAPIVTSDAFCRATVNGDLETIDAFFAQPHVLDDAVATNAWIIETNAADAVTCTRRDGSRPWFRWPTRQPIYVHDLPLLHAARNNHVHVIRWFFTSEHLACISETLALLLPEIARYYDQWFSSKWYCDLLVLETLLTSRVFRECIADNQQQPILDSIATCYRTPALIELAIAHGARLNDARTVIALYGTEELRGDAACFMCADVLLAPSTYWRTVIACDSFLQCREGSSPEVELRDAARVADERRVDDLLADGFVDVDARDSMGRTALMLVASGNPEDDNHPDGHDVRPDITYALLSFCDIDAVDHAGRTALHYAAENNDDVTDILLDMGADTNMRDHNGRAAHDAVEYPWSLLQFVKNGADPFVPPCDEPSPARERAPRSIYSRLTTTPSGREYIEKYPQYFDISSFDK